MDSQVVIVTGQWKIKVILGLGGLITIIILAFLYRIEVGLILLAVGGVTATRLGFWARHQHVLGKLQERQLAAQARAIELEAELAHWRTKQEEAIARKLAYDALFIERKAGTFVIGSLPFKFYPTATASAQLAEPLALPATTHQGIIDLLSILDRAKRVLIHGASEGGKTTLLQHIASRSQGVIIVDPHYEPGKWPSGRVVGKGRNFDEVVAFLNWLDTELDRRSQRMGEGDKNFQPLTIIIDELATIKLHCGNDAIKPLAMMIMESNKFGFRLFIGGHSKLVELLGLKGMGDIREGLFFVHLYYNQTNQQRRATIDLGDGQGEQPCTFPPFANRSEVVLPDLVIQPTSEESDILRYANEGAPYHVISQAVWGDGKIGSYYNRKIDAILQRHGVEIKK